MLQKYPNEQPPIEIDHFQQTMASETENLIIDSLTVTTE